MAKTGRPSAYKPEFAEQATNLCALGATDMELARFFKVSGRTIYRWQIEHPEFCQALKAGKESADERVVRSLYHKAVGYTFDSEKIFQFQGQIVRAKTREHVPPDTTASIFWLKNRKPDEWREKAAIEHSGAVETVDNRDLARAALARIEELKQLLGQGVNKDEPK